ncbi:hypothetical protein J6I39_05845 [bacterium]|nr:hypothetical protein [bacterium]
MKISFTGNHLFNYKNSSVRDYIWDSRSQNNNQKVCKVGDTELLFIDGKELDDYNRALATNPVILQKDFEIALLKAYINNAIKVDLSNAKVY